MGRERRRDGATVWGAFEDVEEDGRYVEVFALNSWLDLRRLRERVTKADREIERRIETMLEEPRRVRFHVAPPGVVRSAIVGRATLPAVVRMLGRRTRG